jgi:hypothetical protein
MEMERTMQKMMQQLLARMDAWRKEMNADQLKVKANQEDLLARMKEINGKQEKAASMSFSVKSNQDLLAQLEARFETGREEYREDLKEIREEIKSGQAEMRSTVCAMRPELEETIQREMRAVIQSIRSELDEMTFKEAAKTKPDPGMMQSIHLQKCSDPKKLWTAEEIDRHRQEDDQPFNTGMAQ